jgi:hypothetical protein
VAERASGKLTASAHDDQLRRACATHARATTISRDVQDQQWCWLRLDLHRDRGSTTS